jgi:hypothetical protein
MTRTRRIVIGSAIAVGLVVALIGILALAFFHTFYPTPPAAHADAAADIRTKQRQDFDYFRNYFDLNRTYTAESRAHAEQLQAQYREKSGSLSEA